MRGLLGAAIVVIASIPIGIGVTGSQAACGSGVGSVTTATGSGSGYTVTSTASASGSCTSEGVAETMDGQWHSDPVCEVGGSATCEVFATCSDGSIEQYEYFVAADGTEFAGGTNCSDNVTEPVEVSASMVLAALRRIPLPPSELIVQPPNGRTLVNFETNFYTETQPLDRTIRLLGQRVDLRIWPSSYAWHFGDGASTATESAGSPYPDLEITHSYASKGTVGPAVDTTYAADYRVNGGAWRPVPGTVTIPGATVALQVVEATPTLVGYR